MTQSQQSAPALLEAREVRHDFRLGARMISVLRGVNLAFAAGETVSIVGKSGAGKTTLLQILGLLEPPTSGEVLLRGQDVAKWSAARRAEMRRREIGFVFQFYHLIRELTALENVLLSARVGEPLSESIRQRASERARAVALLERVGLGARAKHRPSQLSGGELQRVAIARALFSRPSLLLCDEPTGNLDSDTGSAILELLFGLQAELKTTLCLVTHDLELARRCSRQIRIQDGKVAAEPPPRNGSIPSAVGGAE
jgi:predicted ABC-type transport system involved in lysophospholipase L1 biosynthesis ATPase subunit